MVSLGSTGALLAAGLFIIGRIRAIERPGLLPTLPTVDGKGFVMLDVGANAENRPYHLLQYAIMGSYYAKDVRGVENPRVGLLNNGTEANKGDKMHQEAHDLLAAAPGINFVGNVESSDILNGPADVVVTDGFTGNATLKAIEGTVRTVMHMLKGAIYEGGLSGKLGGLFLKGNLKAMASTFDISSYGGAVLLGLKAPLIKAHGAADAETVYYTLLQTAKMVQNGTVAKVADYFDAHPEVGEAKTAEKA